MGFLLWPFFVAMKKMESYNTLFKPGFEPVGGSHGRRIFCKGKGKVVGTRKF
jgi:hypothetical protein